MGAAVATGRDPDATEGAIRAFVDKVLKGDIDSFNSAVLSRVGYELKRSAGQTMMENAARDPLKPRFARVPSGGDTCKFCLMLASRGFVYHTEKAASSFDHYHDGCDCKVVCSWDDGGAEGYGPDAIADRWNDLEWADAELRAERNGTTAEEEYAKRMRQLGESAKRAKRRRKNIGSDVLAARAAKAGASSGVSKKIIEDGAFSKRGFMSSAYGIEIDYATRHGYNELADRLRILLDEDKKARRS